MPLKKECIAFLRHLVRFKVLTLCINADAAHTCLFQIKPSESSNFPFSYVKHAVFLLLFNYHEAGSSCTRHPPALPASDSVWDFDAYTFSACS